MSERPAWAERLRTERSRKSPHWSQLRAATALEEKAREFGLAIPSRDSLLRMVKGWERGDHEPSHFYRSLWSLVYEVPERELFAEMAPSALSVLGLGLVAVEAGSDPGGDPVRPCDALLSGSTLAALALGGAVDSFRVGMPEVDALAAATQSLQRWDRQFGGWVPYQAAVGYVQSAVRLVRGTYSSRVGARLLPAVADLCSVAGWIAYDTGQAQEALRYFSLGVQMAQQGSDAILAARLLCDMARVNADLGNPMQSIELLTLGLHISQPKAPAAVSAKLYSMEAKTFAILGQVKQCEMAIGRAEQRFSVDDGLDAPGWIGYFDRAQFSGVLGSCYRDLAPKGKQFAVQAERSIQEAMTSRNKKQVRNRALDHLNLATVRLSRRELNGMVEQAGKALELATHLKSHRVNMRLHRLSRAAVSVDAKERSVQALHQQVSELPALRT